MNQAQLTAQENQLSAANNQTLQQGQSMVNTDLSNASNYGNQFNTAQSQANQANANLQNYTQQMQGAYDPNTGVGNAESMYNYNLNQGEQNQGFDPRSLATATQNLTQTQNALNNVNNASQSSTGGYGLSGSQLGQYYGSLSQPLQQAAQSQNTSVGNLQQLYQNALQQGQQATTLGVSGEQATSSNLNQVYQNAQAQAAQFAQQMQFYSQLASTQGGLNSQQEAAYGNTVAGYQQAQAAMVAAQGAAAASYAAANQSNSVAALNNQALNAKNAKGSTPATSAPKSTPQNAVQTLQNDFGNAASGIGSFLGSAGNALGTVAKNVGSYETQPITNPLGYLKSLL